MKKKQYFEVCKPLEAVKLLRKCGIKKNNKRIKKDPFPKTDTFHPFHSAKISGSKIIHRCVFLDYLKLYEQIKKF